jgi:hypothetical protein
MPSNDADVLVGCNWTELYQIARRQGVHVTPDMSQEALILVILGEERSPSSINEADAWRDALMAFLLDNWRTVRSQLDCPAASGDPKSCYSCVDAQVFACLVQNKGSLTQIRRKKTT